MPVWTARSRPGSSPPLTLAELYQLKWALGALLALLSLWTVFFFDLSGVALLPAATLAILAAVWRPNLSARLPPVVGRLAFPLLVAFCAADLALNGEVLAALVRLNLLLVLVRTVTPRRPREDLQLLVLCLFLIIVAGVLTLSIGFAAEILLFTALALGYLLLVTLADAAQGDRGEPEGWTAVVWPRLARRLWAVTNGRVVGFAAALFGFVVLVTTVLFVAIPRFEFANSLSLLNLRNRRSLSGFSETVRLGDVTDIIEDTSTALRAELDDITRVPAQPYWRMVALDGYAAGLFRVSREVAQAETLERFPRSELNGSRAARAASAEPVWTLYFEAGVSRYLPVTGEFVRLRLREPQILTRNRRNRAVVLNREPQTMFAYRVTGMDQSGRLADPELAALLLNPPAPGGGVVRAKVDRAMYGRTLLQVPEGAGDRRELARIVEEITGGARLAAPEFAARAADYLARHHRYALRSALPAGDADPFIRWLASASDGHCELFAGSFTLLARQAGLPARLVTGFKGGSWNAFENYYRIRNSDAHAWCEVFDRERGEWFRVDPTPGIVAAAGTPAAGRPVEVDRSWTARLDSLRLLWYRRIVNFDQQTQSAVFESLRSSVGNAGRVLAERLNQWGTGIRDWLLQPGHAARGFAWLTGLTAAAASAWAIRRYQRLAWPRGTTSRRNDPVRQKAGWWLRRLAALGGAERDDALIRDLQRLRYGAAPGWPRPVEVFRRAKRAQRGKRQRRLQMSI